MIITLSFEGVCTSYKIYILNGIFQSIGITVIKSKKTRMFGCNVFHGLAD